MITLEYNNMEGLTLPEGKICSFVDQYIADNVGKDVHLVYSQALILDYFRLAIVRGELDHTKIVVKYCDDIIELTDRGRLKRWPMPDYQCDVLSGLL